MAKAKLGMNGKWDKERKWCNKHDIALTYAKEIKQWVCTSCLKDAFLTEQAQKEAEKRYRTSQKGQSAIKRYEDSSKGKEARQRYLKSEKYKQRRKEYNQRLAESLQIARIAISEHATTEKPIERQRTEEYAPLVQDIREYFDIMGQYPKPVEIVEWATESFNIVMTTELAQELINKAKRR